MKGKNAIKGAIIFLVGAAAGAFGGYAYANSKLKKEYNDITNEEIEKIRTMYKNRMDELENTKKAFESKMNITMMENAVEEKKKEIEKATVSAYQEKVTDYTTFSKSDDKQKEKATKNKDSQIWELISDREFDTDGGFEKMTLTYYPDSKALIDEDENYEDIGNTIGFGALDHFGDFEEDVLYVRNNQLGIDYMVYREYGSFPGGRK